MTVSNAVANATFSEIVFYSLSGEWVTGSIDNDGVDSVCISVSILKRCLPSQNEKMIGCRDYVLVLEPGLCFPTEQVTEN